MAQSMFISKAELMVDAERHFRNITRFLDCAVIIIISSIDNFAKFSLQTIPTIIFGFFVCENPFTNNNKAENNKIIFFIG